MKLNNLLLLSGNPVPLISAQLSIHQPTIKQIGLIGQAAFFSGCQILCFNKEDLTSQDKTNLKDYSNFDIIMSIMKETNPEARTTSVNALLVLTLLFPDYTISFGKKEIILEKDQEKHILDDNNLKDFQKIISSIFCLKDDAQELKPMGKGAQRIADKIKQGKQKKAAAEKQQQEIAIFGRYISVLAVGQLKNIPDLLNYTVFQLFDEYNRYMLKQNYDLYVQQKLAGAKDVQQVDNWMKDLYKKERQSFDKI